MGFPLCFKYCSVTLLLLIAQGVSSDVEFCFNGKVHRLVQYSGYSSGHNHDLHCPYGLLFKEPTQLHAIHSTGGSDGFCIKRSICPKLDGNETEWECGSQRQAIKVQMLTLNSAANNENWDFLANDETIRSDIPECQRPVNRRRRSISGHIPQNELSLEHLEDVTVCLRTKRALKYEVYGVERGQCIL